MDLSSFLTFLGERTFLVSITILALLAIRPLAKKMPRKGMYFLWVILVSVSYTHLTLPTNSLV